jgi:hypothetical protein
MKNILGQATIPHMLTPNQCSTALRLALNSMGISKSDRVLMVIHEIKTPLVTNEVQFYMTDHESHKISGAMLSNSMR